jgi:ribonucleoside-diphosphate reductase alpha chain
MSERYGPTLAISEEIHSSKYRGKGESFYDAMMRLSGTLCDSEQHRQGLKDILLNMRFLPAGRVQAAVGSPHQTTAFNCFVSGTIEDSIEGIMDAFKESALTQRQGGGIGYDFSTIRPAGTNIKTLSSPASGPLSFMHIGDAVCGTVSSAGNRRGAQMGVLRVDHPDIEEFIEAKHNSDNLTRYNISVGITDEFMKCLKSKKPFELKWQGEVVRLVNAQSLWDKLMRSTWDWAEPGVLFIDRINHWNNLYYCETIAATNPCGEQPLPPHGACLLGSFNLVKYVDVETKQFDGLKFRQDIQDIIRMMDNVIDETIYPLPAQEKEAKAKRRMGIGVTGLANALEIMGMEYGSEEFLSVTKKIMKALRDESYMASAILSAEKGSFPLFDKEKYLEGKFVKTLPESIRKLIAEHGIRNSHLISIAPTGTISLSADNISSGCEPVYTYEYDRTIQTPEGPIVSTVSDYAFRQGVSGRQADDVSPQEHVGVQSIVQKYTDSAVSKTCNVGDDVTWEEFKQIYISAYEQGCKGCTTFRAAGKRYGVLNKKKDTTVEEASGEACFIDPNTGEKECG